MKKINIAVVYGGTNTEHEVSIVSARSIISHLDAQKYNVLAIKIGKDNQWKIDLALSSGNLSLPNQHDMGQMPSLRLIGSFQTDIVFPVVHGPFGEDGTLQGLFEMAKIAYVGCPVLSSAVCMDKPTQKMICQQHHIPLTAFKYFSRYIWEKSSDEIMTDIIKNISFPLFVKPANQGSSVGISKAGNKRELENAIEKAFEFDNKVIVEEGVENVREIECSILGNHNPQASILGEIIPSNEFYDYDAKYVDGKSKSVIPANLPAELTTQIQECAKKAFRILDCKGLARVDFLLNGKTNQFYLNELNTMPGFTSISMYPKLWEASGIPYEKLLDKLIELGLESHREKTNVSYTYTPKLPWHEK